MRKFVIVLCMVGAFIPLSSASAADVEFSGSLGAYSSYIWRGYKLSEDALQIQPSATASVAGFSLNVWADYDFDTEEWLEIDYTASFAHEFDKVAVEAGFIHYDVRDGLDSDELYVSAGYNCFLNPSMTVYVDISEGDGAFVVAEVSYPVELSPEASLEFGASLALIADDTYVAVDADGEGFTGLFNGGLTATGSVALAENVSLEPMVGYTFALSDDASDAIKAGSTEQDDAFLYGAITVSVSF